MTETQFIEQNSEKWRELEHLLTLQHKDADKIQELFVKVSSDLSYARTFYPNRSVRVYLNNLTQKVYNTINQKENKVGKKEIIHFFNTILPQTIFDQRKAFYISFIVFITAMLIGIVSSRSNENFTALILGDSYVQMTEKNINEGDPMAVYKDEHNVDMFLGITINNIRVAMIAYVFGIFAGMGTILILLYNGIMVGTFQYFFYSKGLFLTSFLTIWIHGTIEISAIIIAGAAGITLGRGLLFPDTHNRSTSLQISAVKSLRILLGTIPLFVIAGLLESFVTRHTGLPTIVKAFIIGLSALFIIFIFILYPYYHQFIKKDKAVVPDSIPLSSDFIHFEKYSNRSFLDNVGVSFALFRKFFGYNLGKVILPLSITCGMLLWFTIASNSDFLENNYINTFFFYSIQVGGFPSILYSVFTIVILLSYSFLFFRNKIQHIQDILPFLKEHLFFILILSTIYVLPFHLIDNNWKFLLLLVLPPHLLVTLIAAKVEKNSFTMKDFGATIALSFKNYAHYLMPTFVSLVFFYISILLFNSAISSFLSEFFYWHNPFGNEALNYFFLNSLLLNLAVLLVAPILVFLLSSTYYSLRCKDESIDLNNRLAHFGRSNKIFEAR